jgi:hypothetical protein
MKAQGLRGWGPFGLCRYPSHSEITLLEEESAMKSINLVRGTSELGSGSAQG